MLGGFFNVLFLCGVYNSTKMESIVDYEKQMPIGLQEAVVIQNIETPVNPGEITKIAVFEENSN